MTTEMGAKGLKHNASLVNQLASVSLSWNTNAILHIVISGLRLNLSVVYWKKSDMIPIQEAVVLLDQWVTLFHSITVVLSIEIIFAAGEGLTFQAIIGPLE